MDHDDIKWKLRYMDMAQLVSTWSRDPSSKIGAVAVGEKGQILSTGYNGFPRGIADTDDRLNDREEKLSRVIHAEMNVIFNASFNGVSLNGSRVYVSGLPVCSDCAKGLIQVGVKEIVVKKSDIEKSEFWKKSWEKSLSMFNEVKIKTTII